jgi:AraC-like DNA-binding protein
MKRTRGPSKRTLAKRDGGEKPSHFIDINMEALSALCRLNPTLEDAAAFFMCSPDTVERRIKEATGQTFADFRQSQFIHTRSDLLRKALEKVDTSDTIHIHLLKTMCGLTDKGSTTFAIQNNLSGSSVSRFDLEERSRMLRGMSDEQLDEEISAELGVKTVPVDDVS